MAELDALLSKMTELASSDLHLRAGLRPRCRIHGNIEELQGAPRLEAADVERLTMEILTEDQRQEYLRSRELDFSYGSGALARFRCNYFHDHSGPAAVFRRIASEVPTLRSLHMPASVETFAHLRRGLVIVSGSSGSGKTSTLAAIIDVINSTYYRHIITLEDPIEFLHSNKRCIVHQRGLRYDICDFESGIAAAMRQDPDVLLIGELRELGCIRLALAAAEMGLLVFATLHTNGAAETIDRLIDAFPSEEQPQARTLLSQCLAGVVSQALVPKLDGSGLYPATEVLTTTPAISSLIRENRTQEIVNSIQSGKDQGMHTLEDSLEALVVNKIISPEEAYLHATQKARFEKMVALPRESGVLAPRA